MESYNWVFFGLLSAFSTALITVFGKLGIDNIDTTLAATIRAVITAIILIAIFISSGKTALVKSVDNYSLILILLSGVVYAFSWVVYFIALKNGPALKVDALDWVSILFVLMMAPLWGEAITWKSFFGTLLLLAGAFCIVV
jgi:transporter family protein